MSCKKPLSEYKKNSLNIRLESISWMLEDARKKIWNKLHDKDYEEYQFIINQRMLELISLVTNMMELKR